MLAVVVVVLVVVVVEEGEGEGETVVAGSDAADDAAIDADGGGW